MDKIDWADILADAENENEFTDSTQTEDRKQNGERQVLGSLSPKYECHLEFTLTHPHTASWNNKLSIEQKRVLNQKWDLILPMGGLGNIKETGFVYEFHNSGHIHLHGFIRFEFKSKFSPIGLISDYAKAYLRTMTKKYSNYNDKLMNVEFMRYRSPQIAIQYFSHSNNYAWNDMTQEKPTAMGGNGSKRLEYWKTYMSKNQ